MKPREQYLNQFQTKLIRFRLLLAAGLLFAYFLFTSPNLYRNLFLAAGFLLYVVSLIVTIRKKDLTVRLLCLTGEAALIQGLAVLTGTYSSPFLFLFLLSPYIHALTNGPRWAWYSSLIYSPILTYAIITAARASEWRWLFFSAMIGLLLVAETDAIYKMERNNKELINKANQDPLTNLANRHALEEICAGIENGFGREVCTMSMLDLDNFKRFNDLFGHLEGDRLLKKVADVLQENMRGDDLVLRYGGDEFLVILWGANREEAEKAIKRIKDRVWEKARCRISTGTATAFVKKRSEFMELLHQADQELFAKKKENKRAEARLNNHK
ncbi:MAG: GGDEF domain-containing protein [Firmicutes bacterium]|nr:GGDEF domain-containing protein [Bacillota bacterium]